jgi:hypothetical protein
MRRRPRRTDVHRKRALSSRLCCADASASATAAADSSMPITVPGQTTKTGAGQERADALAPARTPGR